MEITGKLCLLCLGAEATNESNPSTFQMLELSATPPQRDGAHAMPLLGCPFIYLRHHQTQVPRLLFKWWSVPECSLQTKPGFVNVRDDRGWHRSSEGAFLSCQVLWVSSGWTSGFSAAARPLTTGSVINGKLWWEVLSSRSTRTRLPLSWTEVQRKQWLVYCLFLV